MKLDIPRTFLVYLYISFRDRFRTTGYPWYSDESRRRPSVSKIKFREKIRIRASWFKPIKSARFPVESVVSHETIRRSCFTAAVQRRVYYRCFEARRKWACKRGYWHNSGIFLEILRGRGGLINSRVCAISRFSSRRLFLRKANNRNDRVMTRSR